MTLKTASLLALIGTLLLTVLCLVDFIHVVAGVLNGVIAALEFLRSLVYLFASLSLTLFFYAFHKAQPR